VIRWGAALLLGAAGLGQQAASRPAAELDAEAGRAVRDRALGFLVSTQRPSGAWGAPVLENSWEMGFSVETFHAWQVAAHALATLALLEAEATPDRDRALARAVAWLCDVRMPLRGSDWDNDAVWAWLYGTVACVRLVEDPRLSASERERVEVRGREFLRWLLKNQVPEGGFGYYDDPTFTQRPKWATSFCTALVLPALQRAESLGWLEDGLVRRRATAYVRACRLPTGAITYDLTPIPRVNGGEHINDVKGSLGRIQVAHWGLHASGDPSITLAQVREGLQRFFEHHRFLAVARMRPIPHEAYYLNAGYFYFFGHYYCALAIGLLPEPEREAWHRQLRARIAPTQRADGSFCDFLGSNYLVTASTAFAALALTHGLPRGP
jgi:hypothetical protein